MSLSSRAIAVLCALCVGGLCRRVNVYVTLRALCGEKNLMRLLGRLADSAYAVGQLTI